MRSWDAFSRQPPRDLAKALSRSVLVKDPVHDRAWNDDRPAGWTWRSAWTGRLDVLRDEALELVDGNETLTPRRLHRVDGRDKSPVDRGDAHAESLSRLAAAIGEAPNLLSLSEIEMRKRPRSGRVVLTTSALPAPFSPCAQGVVQ
jgi:hypothetical protein